MSFHKVFAVKDVKAGAFLPPFHFPTEGVAIRALTDCVKDPSHRFGANPEDYDLYRLGEFDDEHGTYDLHDAPVHVVSCHTLIPTE